MGISKKQMDAILALPAPKRYSHFIKKVVGWRRMWGLYNAGWAMSETKDGKLVFPLWPEREYAELCIGGSWAEFTPKEIEIDEVLDSMIPMLREKNILPGVFFTPSQGSVDANLDELERDLRAELSRYK